MDKLGKLLPRVLARQPNSGHIVDIRVRLAFREVLGPDLAQACEEVDFQRNVLTVCTSNPALAHQLRLDSPALLERLNGMGLPRRVREIRVRTGRRSAAP